MNIKQSIDVALAISKHNNSYVAKKMGMSKQSFSQLKARKNLTMKTVDALADVFEMSASEFIKLGE